MTKFYRLEGRKTFWRARDGKFEFFNQNGRWVISNYANLEEAKLEWSGRPIEEIKEEELALLL